MSAIDTTVDQLEPTLDENELIANVAHTKKFNAPCARSFSSGV